MTMVPACGDAPAAQAVNLGGTGVSSRQEAEDRAVRFIRGAADLEALAQEMFDRRDWETLGYESWAAYVKARFGNRAQEARKPVMELLSSRGATQQQIADVTGVSQRTVSNDLADLSNPIAKPDPSAKKRCTTCGESKPVSEFGTRKSAADGLKGVCRTCLANDARERQAAKTVKPSPRKAKREAEIAELQGIRRDGDEHKYQAMLAAPRSATNRPLIDRAEKIEDLLGDLCALSPEDAVTMMPANRCREFTIERARWWLDFAEHCEKRRASETPQLPPMKRWSRNAASNQVLAAAEKIAPEAERELAGQARAVLDWLRANADNEGWATEAQIGLGINAASSSVGNRLRALVAAGFLEIGRDGRAMCYRAKSAN